MQLYYKISEVSQIPMKYIINDAGVIKDANKLRGVKNKVVPFLFPLVIFLNEGTLPSLAVLLRLRLPFCFRAVLRPWGASHL